MVGKLEQQEADGVGSRFEACRAQADSAAFYCTSLKQSAHCAASNRWQRMQPCTMRIV